MLETLSFSPDELPEAWSEHIRPLVCMNTNPPHYLVGGAITRILINRIHGANLPIRNYDFAVETLAANPRLPEGWSIKKNSYGNWKIVSTVSDAHADVWPFSDWQRHGRVQPTTIEEAIAGVPVNIQAVAYSLTHECLYYHPEFLRGIRERRIRILCKAEHAYHCELMKIAPEQDLRYRAERFGFEYEL